MLICGKTFLWPSQDIWTLTVTFNNATFNWIVQNLFIFLPSKHHEKAIYHPKWMKCSLCTTAEHGRNSRLRGGAMQSNSPLRSTTSVVSHLLTYLHNGRSQTMLPNFYPFWPPTYPLLTFVGEFPYCHIGKICCAYHWHFQYLLPTWSCQRSLWTTPYM